MDIHFSEQQELPASLLALACSRSLAFALASSLFRLRLPYSWSTTQLNGVVDADVAGCEYKIPWLAPHARLVVLRFVASLFVTASVLCGLCSCLYETYCKLVFKFKCCRCAACFTLFAFVCLILVLVSRCFSFVTFS